MNLIIKSIRLHGVAGLAAALTLASTARADDFQIWQTVSLKWLDTKHVDLTTRAQTRIYDDSSDFSLCMIRSVRGADEWRHAHVLGTGLAFSL